MSSQAPDFSVAGIGYRVFGVQGLRLKAQHNPHLWPARPGEWMEATCPRCEHVGRRLPGAECRCGIHALWRADQFDRDPWMHEQIGYLAGAVAIEGLVIPHWNCFRAERARVVALVGTGEWPRQVAQGIEVPLVSDVESLRDAALEHGDELPLDRRPEAPAGAQMYDFQRDYYFTTDQVDSVMKAFGPRKGSKMVIASTARSAQDNEEFKRLWESQHPNCRSTFLPFNDDPPASS